MHSKELWPFIFLLGLLFFNYPILDLVDVALPYYLYTAWALFILMIGLLVTLSQREEKKIICSGAGGYFLSSWAT